MARIFWLTLSVILSVSVAVAQEQGDKWQKDTPESAIGMLLVGKSLLKQNLFEPAIQFLEAALSLKPDYYLANFNLALVYSRRSREDAGVAERYFNDAVTIARGQNISDPSLYNTYGVFLMNNHDYERASDYLKLALAIDPQNPKANNNLGMVSEKMGSMEDAQVYYARAAMAGNQRAKVNLARLSDQVVLSISFRGEKSAAYLAKAYEVLVRQYRPLIQTAQSAMIDPKEEIFWKAIVRHSKWPQEAWQEKSFAETLHDAGSGKYWIPDTNVSTEVWLDTVPLPAGWNPSRLTKKQQTEVCFKNGWTNITVKSLKRDPNSTCVVKIQASEKFFGLKETTGIIVIKKTVYVLRLNQIIEPDKARQVRNSILQELKKQDDAAVTNTKFITQPEVVLENQAPAAAAPPACNDAALQGHHQLVQWPDKLTPSLIPTHAIVADEGIDAIIDPDDPEFLTNIINHPVLQRSSAATPMIVPCEDLLAGASQKEQRGEHALSVASVIYGNALQFRDTVGQLHLSNGFLPRSKLLFYPTSLLAVSAEWQPARRTFIAPYDLGSRDDSARQEAIKAAKTLSLASGVIIVSAPRRIGEEPYFREYNYLLAGSQPPTVKVCGRFPACLGATPYALVVAALDNTGKALLEQDKYKLGSSVVGIAAPGHVLPTAAYQGTTPKYAFRSGSSFAAPVVGAVALALQSEPYAIEQSARILARIAATADVVRQGNPFPDPDQVRFGTLNAMRALTGAERNQKDDVIWDSSGAHKFGRVEGRNYESSCVPNAPLGYIRLFEDGVTYYGTPIKATPTCIPVNLLLRLVKTGNDKFGHPTFTVVYYQSAPDGTPIPVIRRGALFYSNVAGAPVACLVASGPAKDACLATRSVAGKMEPLNLTDFDIVFSVSKIEGG